MSEQINHYQILEKLGEGGMGVVYKALDTRLDREVAIKFILRERVRPDRWEEFRARLEKEARVLAKLSHPNIVSILDYGERDGEPYIVMEYISGGSLADQVGKPMTWQEAVRIILGVARGLEHAHKRGILHRDIKPGNILLTDDGFPKITDFGLVKTLESMDKSDFSQSTVGIGTALYMAPEQALGKSIDERADIYSLGVVLYELSTGRNPFTGNSSLEVLLKQVNDSLPRPKNLVSNLPDSLEKIILRALEKQPDARYQSASKFCDALNLVSDSQRPTSQKRLSLIMLPVIIGILIFIIFASKTVNSLFPVAETPTAQPVTASISPPAKITVPLASPTLTKTPTPQPTTTLFSTNTLIPTIFRSITPTRTDTIVFKEPSKTPDVAILAVITINYLGQESCGPSAGLNCARKFGFDASKSFATNATIVKYRWNIKIEYYKGICIIPSTPEPGVSYCGPGKVTNDHSNKQEFSKTIASCQVEGDGWRRVETTITLTITDSNGRMDTTKKKFGCGGG